MTKQFVIIEIGKAYVLKQKIASGLFGAGIYRSKDLNKVKEYAANNNLTVSAIGDIYEV